MENTLLTVKELINDMQTLSYPQLFSRECISRLNNVAAVLGDRKTNNSIIEVVLSEKQRTLDYSMTLFDDPRMEMYGYEIDYDGYKDTNIIPCVFLDAYAFVSSDKYENFCTSIFPSFAGKKRADVLLPMLRKCVSLIHGTADNETHIGLWDGRNIVDCLRLVIYGMTREHIRSYLAAVQWKGNFENLDALLSDWEPECLGDFVLNLDVFADHIGSKISIMFWPKNMKYETVRTLLDRLVQKGFCLPAKRDGMMQWLKTYPKHSPRIYNNLAHFKFMFDGQNANGLKGYVTQTTYDMAPYYKAYRLPYRMEVELICADGSMLDKKSLMYWLGEFASCGVETVDLFGSSTAQYPYLRDAADECHRLGIQTNVMLRPAENAAQTVRELVSCGVESISIPVVRPDDSRIRILAQLNEMNYAGTRILWKFSRASADGFSAVLSCAEQYGVKELEICSVPPDCAARRDDFPEESQMRALDEKMAKYTGPVHVVSSRCFPQMKTLNGEYFLVNKNTGLERGCTAGRSSACINVSGKLMPCRYLNFPDDSLSLEYYWNNSPVLTALRNADDAPESLCSSCTYRKFCVPCMAENAAAGRIYMGKKECSLGEKK